MSGAYDVDALAEPQRCRNCGCTESDCSGCIKHTGASCMWIEPDLCSACAPQGVWADLEGDNWVVAASAADAAVVYLEVTGSDPDEAGPWTRLPDDEPLCIEIEPPEAFEPDSTGENLVTKTAKEWAACMGRGYLGGLF